jgi:dolichol-phosphate mannosyltransferase
MAGRRFISIVTPCYNEELNIKAHFERVRAAVAPFRDRYDFEYIYTDNCSEDRTFEELRGLCAAHPEARAIRFSRNIGANRAIYIGLQHAAGDAAVLIQADLQDPPELIPDFIRGWEEGYDVVYGRIRDRDENALMRWLRRSYYAAVSRLSEVSPPENAGEFRLTSRRVLKALEQYHEDDIYLRGVIAHIGFRQKRVDYDRAARAAGRSSIGLAGLAGYAINGLLSTTVVPIRAVVVVGLGLSGLGFLLTLWFLASKFIFRGVAPHGWTLQVCLLTFFSGAQLFAIGIIGEYIRKIYVQSLRMPRGFIQDKVNFG